uniref:NYN domain-containing protein n=1 Tax=Tetraselmis sp. GSL018 TaxID=582737 RepID=A0A061SCA8_9CHLO
MIVDIALFAVDQQATASIVVIPGECDLSPILEKLQQRGYKVLEVTGPQSPAAAPGPRGIPPWAVHECPALAPPAGAGDLPTAPQASEPAAAPPVQRALGSVGDRDAAPARAQGPAAVQDRAVALQLYSRVLQKLAGFVELHPQGLDVPTLGAWIQKVLGCGGGSAGTVALLEDAQRLGIIQVASVNGAIAVFPARRLESATAAGGVGGGILPDMQPSSSLAGVPPFKGPDGFVPRAVPASAPADTRAQRLSRLSPQLSLQLLQFLRANPHGVSAADLRVWADRIAGGLDAIGYASVPQFMEDLAQTGHCVLSQSHGTVRAFSTHRSRELAALAAGEDAPPAPPGGVHPQGRAAISRRTLAPLVRFLEKRPRGADGGEVNKLIKERFGGVSAFGFDRLKSFLQAAELAGVCRLRTEGTLWVLPAPPPPASPQLVPGPPPISPAAVDRIRAAVLRDGRITGENFPELVAYLKGFPDGVDGGVLNLWLQDSVGGYQALGYSRFKSLLQDAENAGICRCSTDKGTMWVKALGEPDPQGGAFGAPATDLPKSQSNPLLPGGSIGTASPTASAGGPGRPWQQWAPHGAPSAEDPVISGGGGALGGGLPIGPRRSFQGRAAAPFLGGAELEVKNVAAPGAAGRRQPPPIGEGRKPPPPPQHSAAPPGQPPSPGAQAMLMAAEMGADRVSPGGRAPFSSEPDIAPRQWVQLLFGSGGEGSSPNCGPFDLWPSLASTAERLTPAREQAI